MVEEGRFLKGQRLSRREFIRLVGLSSVGLLTAACGGAASQVPTEPEVVEKVVEKEVVVTATPPAQEPVDVHYTTMMAPEIMDPLLYDLVAERTTDINLTADVIPSANGWDVYADNLITRIAGGESLDVVDIAVEGMALLSEKNIIRPLDPFLEEDTMFKEDIDKDIHPTLLKILQWKGKQMLMPSGWNNMVMHYNYKIFEEKGVEEPTEDWTWDDFLEASLKIADVKGAADDLYAYSWWDAQFGMAPWYFNNDTSPLTDDWTDSNMDDPKVAETLQFLADLILKHKVAPNPTGWDEWGQFHSSHLAMRGCGGWCISGAKNDHFFDYKFQYYPHKAGPLKTVVGVGGHGITTLSANPEEAWEVLKLINGPQMSLRTLIVDGSPPARRSIVEMDEFKNTAQPAPADMSIFYESLDYAKVVPSPPNFNIIDPLLLRWYAQIWNGQISVEEAVVGAHQELQAEMDKLKEG